MTIGDVNSTARGSGARYNDGKVPLELLPLAVLSTAYTRAVPNRNEAQAQALCATLFLAEWQQTGDTSVLYEAIEALGSPWHECARVFDYGRRKYAEWNWAKGMKWSVPFGCTARHLEAIILKGETHDAESGLLHVGHATCNLVMLITFAKTFPDGDDRPRMLAPAAVK